MIRGATLLQMFHVKHSSKQITVVADNLQGGILSIIIMFLTIQHVSDITI